jgi:hypothetical protein
VCIRVKNLSSVGWDSVVGSDGVLCSIVHGTGNAMLMRGGACAAELRLLGSGIGSRCYIVCVFVFYSFRVSCFILRDEGFFALFFWILGCMC